MIVSYKTLRLLLFDGSEQELIGRSFDLGEETGIKTPVKFEELVSNNFEDLKDINGSGDFAFILKTGGFAPDGGLLNLYKGSHNLRLYYLKKDRIIIVSAFGEFQPARYMLWIEGTWLLA